MRLEKRIRPDDRQSKLPIRDRDHLVQMRPQAPCLGSAGLKRLKLHVPRVLRGRGPIARETPLDHPVKNTARICCHVLATKDFYNDPDCSYLANNLFLMPLLFRL